MKSITFHCEVITPMFLAGADGKTPELRPPSIKGAMRFWWRAMNGHLSLAELKEKEVKIFGGSYKDNIFKSMFDIDINIKEKKIIKGKEVRNIAYDYNKKTYTKGGLAYLFYIFFNQQKNRDGFEINSKFDITISGYNTTILKEISYILWVLSKFGSLGSRSRRGAGAFEITGIDYENVEDYELFSSSIQEGLNKVYNLFKKETKTDNNKINEQYSNLQKADIYISKNGKSDWHTALNEIGEIMRKERVAPAERNFKKRKFTINTLNQKAAYGLPIKVRNDNEMNFYNKKENSRRASPLYISITKENNKFYWTLIHFKSQFMPDDFIIHFETKNKKIIDNRKEKKFNKVDKKSLNNFIKKVKDKSAKIELIQNG